ncbi:hypothetical protein D3C81_2057770 [compost metagenome]
MRRGLAAISTLSVSPSASHQAVSNVRKPLKRGSESYWNGLHAAGKSRFRRGMADGGMAITR